ncbi:MAG: terminase family protein [Ectothiorhodospiraceae bacterium]|nr:terminase family protein [Ectothiorhodospiraceae bacterium]
MVKQPDTSPDLSPRQHARALYWQGWRIARIAELLDEKPSTIHSWKRRDSWDEAGPLERVEGTLEARLIQLIAKDGKEGKDFKEIDLLGRQIERIARVHRYQETGREFDLNPNIHNRNAVPHKKPRKNVVDEEGVERIADAFRESLFDYQRTWWRAGHHQRIRNLLKSRQIGATWYFAREAIVDALQTGKNKIFMSASKAQAHVFRQYIVQFVKEVTGMELRGDPLVLDNGAHLYFLGTNARTAQSYHGDIYMDEYFWIQRFQEFRKVASGMAMHKKWRQTYFSTPSSVSHEAYPFWTGELYNKRRAKADRVEIEVTHAALKQGRACGDGQWRQIVTVEDAIAGGCDLFDLDQLRLEYSQDEFENLLMCQFVDDTLSVFPLAKLQGCMVDSWEVWRDFQPLAARPLGNHEVWLGYDPSGDGEGGDGAGLIALAPSRTREGKHRIVEKIRLRGLDYEQQAERIRKLTQTYNVTFIAVDTTGIGDAVAELVERFFPAVTRIRYTPDVKARLVMKAQNVIDRDRLEFDAGWTDLAQSFMAIRRTMTDGGGQLTYVAGRRADTGHAELAWATMHALYNEPLDGPAGGAGRSMMEIFG